MANISKHKAYIIENCPNGFSCVPTAIRLLEDAASLGGWNEEIVDELKNKAFKRADDVYLFPEQIAEKQTLWDLTNTAEEWIENFGCFSLNALRERFQCELRNLSEDLADFEEFFNVLSKNKYKTIWYPSVDKTRLTRGEADKDGALKEMIRCISALIDERGNITEVDILEHIPALDSVLLASIVKTHLQDVKREEHNGLTWYLKHDTSLPDDLSEKIAVCIQKIESVNLPVNEAALQLLLSLEYQENFIQAHSISDNKTFRELIAQYYKDEKRKWKNGVFFKDFEKVGENPAHYRLKHFVDNVDRYAIKSSLREIVDDAISTKNDD